MLHNAEGVGISAVFVFRAVVGVAVHCSHRRNTLTFRHMSPDSMDAPQLRGMLQAHCGAGDSVSQFSDLRRRRGVKTNI